MRPRHRSGLYLRVLLVSAGCMLYPMFMPYKAWATAPVGIVLQNNVDAGTLTLTVNGGTPITLSAPADGTRGYDFAQQAAELQGRQRFPFRIRGLLGGGLNGEIVNDLRGMHLVLDTIDGRLPRIGKFAQIAIQGLSGQIFVTSDGRPTLVLFKL